MGAAKPGSLADETLVERTAAGDETAFATLFERHAPLLRARVKRMLSPSLQRKVSISDVLQEARIVAFQACGGFTARGEGSVRAWLLRIAQIKAYEAVRRFTGVAKRDAGREVTRGARPDTDQLAARGPSPSEVAIAGELHDAVARAMARLPDDHRQILKFVGVQGMTFPEAGERMGRTHEAARKLYGRALSAFTERLAAERGEDDRG